MHASLRQSLTDGERQVLDLFSRHLPPDWEIYVQPHLNGLRPDFVLLHPNIGIAVFEVKDWNLDVIDYHPKLMPGGRTELWACNGSKHFSVENKNPFNAVARYKERIFNLYCPRLQQRNGYAAITAGVIFSFRQRRTHIQFDGIRARSSARNRRLGLGAPLMGILSSLRSRSGNAVDKPVQERAVQDPAIAAEIQKLVT